MLSLYKGGTQDDFFLRGSLSKQVTLCMGPASPLQTELPVLRSTSFGGSWEGSKDTKVHKNGYPIDTPWTTNRQPTSNQWLTSGKPAVTGTVVFWVSSG